MAIRTFVKGETYFGRTPVSDTHATFEAISYTFFSVGDYMLYLYPSNGTHLLYKIESIMKTYSNDLPYIITGKMIRLSLMQQPENIYNDVINEMNKYTNHAA